MAAPVFIGDELAAAGYRLAGVRVRVPAAGEETEALAEARSTAPLVLVCAAAAARIDLAALRTALVAVSPLVVIVPDTQGDVAVPDLAARLRTQLGLEA
jgi:vacuolar-type H+-ATPase subunit F/Vma7